MQEVDEEGGGASPEYEAAFGGLSSHAAAASGLWRREEGALRCFACAHRCRIAPGRAGRCRVRFHQDGELRVPFGYVAGLQADPIEKKPFYHVLPGCTALSFGMLGCNFQCAFCQNWSSSQCFRDAEAGVGFRSCSAERMVDMAVECDAPVIVSTYNEPLITAEWSVSVFELAKARGLRCGWVSNGFATPEALAFLRPYIDLYKVDLKCFTEEGYHSLGGRLQPVLETIERLVADGVWVEVVTLVVPDFNDSEAELSGIAAFIKNVSPDIPWHVTAFHPTYKMTDRSRTSLRQLDRAWNAGRAAGLRYVYAGNRAGQVDDRENTRCGHCGALLVERRGFRVLQRYLEGGCCPQCKAPIPGLWR